MLTYEHGTLLDNSWSGLGKHQLKERGDSLGEHIGYLLFSIVGTLFGPLILSVYFDFMKDVAAANINRHKGLWPRKKTKICNSHFRGRDTLLTALHTVAFLMCPITVTLYKKLPLAKILGFARV